MPEKKTAAKKSAAKSTDKIIEKPAEKTVKRETAKGKTKTPAAKMPTVKKTPVIPQKASLEERMEPAAKKTAAKIPAQKKPARNYFFAVGKRKTAVALARLYVQGKGNITVNERTFENYFPLFIDQDRVLSPLRLASLLKDFDVSARISGGGVHAQAEALRHAISKALLLHDQALRQTLKAAGFLTRDSRIKERKKYGLKRARRAPQWQKR